VEGVIKHHCQHCPPVPQWVLQVDRGQHQPSETWWSCQEIH
jgi:hypothetical protein